MESNLNLNFTRQLWWHHLCAHFVSSY